jgi:sugar/nucleoside kinase (ribokinase family)
VQKRFDVVGFGNCAVDFLGLLDHYPGPDEKMPMLAFARQGGGLTGTALTACARLGARAAYIGKLSTDEYGDFLLQEFEREGIDTSGTIRSSDTSVPISFVLVHRDTGERRICWYWNPDRARLGPEELSRRHIEDSRVLFLDIFHPEAGKQAAEWARAAGARVVLDADNNHPGVAELIRLSDVVMASERFARSFTGAENSEAALERLFEYHPATVVLTLGERGALCRTPGETLHVSAFKVEVVDTTGAGDVFHGAFVVAMLRDWPLQKCLEFASAVAAMKCRHLGGRAGIPSFEEAMAFLRKQGTPGLWQS